MLLESLLHLLIGFWFLLLLLTRYFEGLDLLVVELLVYFEFFLQIFDELRDLLALNSVCFSAESIISQNLLLAHEFQIWRIHASSRNRTPRSICGLVIFSFNVIFEKVAVGPVDLHASSILQIHELVQMHSRKIPVDLI